MGSKNSKGFNQEALDMFKNGQLNQFDLNRLIASGHIPPMAYQQNTPASNLNGNRFHPMPNSVGALGFPPKPPRQPGEPNVIMTGSLAGSRMSLLNSNDINSKGTFGFPRHVNYQRPMKYDSNGSLGGPMYESNPKPVSSSMYNVGSKNSSSKESTTSQGKSSSGGGMQQPTKSTLLQELLECPICMNLYDNPHVLPCQHTFCKKCIVSLQNNNGVATNTLTTIDCPICREKHTLINGVESLTANYTMKRLIELDAVQVASEKEKQMAAAKERMENEEATKELVKPLKAKCFSCQKFAYLKVCVHCSYTLCFECTQNPDHDVIIESKINSKKYLYGTRQPAGHTSFRTPRCESINYRPSMQYSPRRDVYMNMPKMGMGPSPISIPASISEQPVASPPPQMPQHAHTNIHPGAAKLKLILLCHSSAVETSLEENGNKDNEKEIYQDEYGKCSTFSKISISASDRVITLKKLIENQFGISCNDQILVYKDKMLNNDLKLLSHYKLRQYSRIHIFDERDIKESDGNEDDAVFGVYQQGNFGHAEARNKVAVEKKSQRARAEENERELQSSSSSEISGSTPTEEDVYESPRRRAPPARSMSSSKAPRHKQPLQRVPIVLPVCAVTGGGSTRSTNYYTLTSNKYRRLDEIFDRSLQLGPSPGSNY